MLVLLVTDQDRKTIAVGRLAPGQLVRVSGERHWLVNSFAMVGADQRHLQGFTALDVTERVRAKKEA